MRALLVAACGIALSVGAACAPRSQPYRFSMSMLGGADVPPPSLPGPPRKPDAPPRSRASDGTAVASSRASSASRTRAPHTQYAYGWQTDAQAGIRTASAKGIELSMPDASAESAAAVPSQTSARGLVISRLPAPHKPATGLVAALDIQGWDHIREATDLRRWVGRRDKRAPHAIVLAWLADLGLGDDALAAAGNEREVVAWATQHGRLLGPTDLAQPGDLLVFDRAVTNEPADLIAIVIGRDSRGVSELVYAAHGTIRRGFVDAAHPSSRRDLRGAVLNTFLRHGKQWPPKGTRYLAGELLAYVVRMR